MSLKEKVEGNELDLSLNQLTEVPVKELAAVPKATLLDISCNRIRSLPREFSSLTHLVKIDLSSNGLLELPDNFGNLHNLQYLDLYSNQLVNLPVSFCRLKNLRWLDLKNNPLEPKLKAVAGDCLDEKECQDCAKKIVSYMQTLDSDLEREKQKKLKAVREQEAIEKAKVVKELEEQRRVKKLEREKRKAESKAKREAQLLLEKEQYDDDSESSSRLNEDENFGDEDKSFKESNFCLKFFMLIVTVLLTILFLYLLLENEFELYGISSSDIKTSVQQFVKNFNVYAFETSKLIRYYAPVARANMLKIVHQYMITMTHVATKIEEMVSVYFQ